MINKLIIETGLFRPVNKFSDQVYVEESRHRRVFRILMAVVQSQLQLYRVNCKILRYCTPPFIITELKIYNRIFHPR